MEDRTKFKKGIVNHNSIIESEFESFEEEDHKRLYGLAVENVKKETTHDERGRALDGADLTYPHYADYCPEAQALILRLLQFVSQVAQNRNLLKSELSESNKSSQRDLEEHERKVKLLNSKIQEQEKTLDERNSQIAGWKQDFFTSVRSMDKKIDSLKKELEAKLQVVRILQQERDGLQLDLARTKNSLDIIKAKVEDAKLHADLTKQSLAIGLEIPA